MRKEVFEIEVSEMLGMNVVLKEMTEEQFEKNVLEGDIKRDEAGRFSETGRSGIGREATNTEARILSKSKSVIGKKTRGKILLAVVAGFEILKGTNFANFFGRRLSEKVVREITGTAEKTKTVQSILNIKVNDELKLFQKLEGLSGEVARYVRNPKLMQKDLIEAFGHLDVSGCEHISLKFDERSRLSDKLHEVLQYNFSYDIWSDTMHLNLHDLRKIQNSINIGPKQIIAHEYAHSITRKNPDIAMKYLEDYMESGRKLIGKEMELWIPGVFGIGSVEKIKITNMSHHMYSSEEAYEAFLSGARQTGKIVDETKFSKNAMKRVDSLWFGITTDFGAEGVLTSESIPVLLGGAISSGIPLRDALKCSGWDQRDLYALSTLSEYCSVLVEKGGRL